MKEAEQLATEKLVPIHRVRDEWEGTLLVGYLRDNAVEASLREPSALPPFDAVEQLTGHNPAYSISVLEPNAARARQLVKEFLEAATDDSVLAETAAQELHVDKETIHRLRGELEEERATFQFVEWLGIGFLTAAALLWMIWPAWLKSLAPLPGLRWVLIILLAGAAGLWTRSKT
jgi:hypothetical protein